MGFLFRLFGLPAGVSLLRVGVGLAVALVVGLAAGGTVGYRYATGRAAVVEAARLKADASAREKLTREKQEAEDASSTAVAVVTAHYEEVLSHDRKQRDKDVAAAYAGALRLRIPTYSADEHLSAAQSAACQCDGQAGTELPRAVTANLYGLVNDCNAIVDQLTAAQGVILAQQKVCGTSAP